MDAIQTLTDVAAPWLGYGLWFLVAIAVLVASHEFGHYLVARLSGVRVLRFSVGFGPALLRWRRGETEFRIAAIPIGGYVKMLESAELEGMDAAERAAAENQTFDGLNPWYRIAIALGGPFANLVLAFLAYWLILVIGATVVTPHVGRVAESSPATLAGLRGGEELLAIDGRGVSSAMDVSLALSGRLGDTGILAIEAARGADVRTYEIPIENWHHGEAEPDPFGSLGLELGYPPLIGAVEDGAPGALGGLQAGDRLVAIDGLPAGLWDDFLEAVRGNPGRTLTLRVERDGDIETLRVTPRSVVLDDGREIGQVGVALRYPTRLERLTPWAAVPKALEDTVAHTVLTLNLLRKMVTGGVSSRNIGGPIAIAQAAGDFARAGWEPFLTLLALLSISLAVINLLPVPLLDGGHVMYCAVELVRRRPLSLRAQAVGSQIGMALVAGLMVLAIYNDITRAIG